MGVIVKRKADNVVDASFQVSMELLGDMECSDRVIIKPNIVEPIPPPVTTDVDVVKGVLMALAESGIQDVSVAEGSGTGDTMDNFRELGYTELGCPLIDLDREETVTVKVDRYNVWEEIVLPAVMFGAFIISVPVLKEHSMHGVTISLKNMVGVLPAEHYSGYWTFKKSMIHKYDTDGCIADINTVLKPDMAVVDATIGMKGSHLSGTPLSPPLNMVYGSTDPLEADRYGTRMLGRDPDSIRYLNMIGQSAGGEMNQ